MSLYAVTDPATGELVGTYTTASDADIEGAAAAAHQAYREWGLTTTVAERGALLQRAADLMKERAREFGEIISREMGKPVGEATGETEFSAAILEYYARNAEPFLADEPLSLGSGTDTALIRRSGIGALLGIMPWNFPVYQVVRFAGPNLALGNTIVLKHAPQCPESAKALERLFRDAGFPDGAYVNIFATNEQISTLIADPRIQGISLTGSERAGAAVAEQAGRHLKKVVLELGGSDPFILLATDDMDATVKDAVSARLFNAGQACNAGKRFVVLDEFYDDFVTKFTEAMCTAEVAPLSSLAAAQNLAHQVDMAVAAGAQLSGAEERDGAHFSPGVLTNVTPDNPAYRQELFGPVAMVFRAADEAAAVEMANDTAFGLGAYVYTPDVEQATRVADQLATGMVFINCVNADAAELPFGGVRRSGFGRELGRPGIEEFVNRKMIRARSASTCG